MKKRDKIFLRVAKHEGTSSSLGSARSETEADSGSGPGGYGIYCRGRDGGEAAGDSSLLPPPVLRRLRQRERQRTGRREISKGISASRRSSCNKKKTLEKERKKKNRRGNKKGGASSFLEGQCVQFIGKRYLGDKTQGKGSAITTGNSKCPLHFASEQHILYSKVIYTTLG